MTYQAKLSARVTDPRLTPSFYAMFQPFKGDTETPMTFGWKLEDLPLLIERVKTIRATCEKELLTFETPPQSFFLQFDIQIWEEKPNSWGTKSVLEPQGLPTFPSCHLHVIDFISSGKRSFIEVRKSSHVTEPERRDGGNTHRSILVTKKFWRTAGEHEIVGLLDLIGNEKHLEEVFACFAALG
ncbi:MAG: hypothetical protein ACAH17_03455 [Candidatus Paceibacterota bacterium]